MAGPFATKLELEKAIRYLKDEITAIRQSGTAGGTTPIAPGVPSSRTINTTAPLSGGGDLSADRTISLAGLASLGTENYLVGVAAGGLAWEYKAILGTANQVTVTHGAGTVTLSLPQDIHTEAFPTFQGMILGPEGSEDNTWLYFRAYFDFGQSESEDLIAGAISAGGSGHTATGSTDVPGTRGTEWNLETHEFVSKTGLTQNANPNGCLGGGLLITENTTTGQFEGYSTTTGLLVRSTVSNPFSQIRGMCSDGTYFYVVGYKPAPGNERSVVKYRISDFALIATWDSVWPDLQAPWGIRHNGGYLYTWDMTLDKFIIVNASTMAKDSEIAGPEYSPGNKYIIEAFDIDTAGNYIYALGEPAAGMYFIKIDITDGSLVATGTTNIGGSSGDLHHYAEGAEERYYVAFISGGSYAGKMNPATLDWYYAPTTAIGHQPWGVAADENFIYAFFEDQGIDRHYKNDIGATASTEAGILRLWINALGSLTQAGMIDSGLNLSMFGYVEGTQLKSTIATGTPPIVVASETLVPNLNADMVDGYEAADFALAGHNHDLSSLDDVLIPSGEPTQGDALLWDSVLEVWSPGKPTAEMAMADLSDVLISSGEPADGQVLIWDELSGYFIPGNPIAVMGMADLTDVLISSGEPADGDVLTWDDAAGKWVPAASAGGAAALDDLTDVNAGSPSTGDILMFDGAEWINTPSASADHLFYDEFDDASVGWGWLQDANSGTIVESGSALTITAPAGSNCDWWSTAALAPVVYLPFFGGPFEVITKINSYSEGANTASGLGICLGAAGATTSVWVIQHVKGSGAASLNCQQWGSAAAATAAVATLPIWFRIRLRPGVGTAAGSWTAIFGYSTDGSSFTDLYSFTNVTADRICLFSKNWVSGASYYISAAPFEYVEVNSVNEAGILAASALAPFEDNFLDSSIFGDWVQYGTGASKTITESAGGTLDFAAASGQDCSSGNPRCFLPLPYWPCEIETKISAYNKGERTKAGMFIGPDGIGWSAVGNVYLEQIFSTGDGLNNISVEDASSGLATAANSTIPKWLKIRCMGSHKYAQWLFYYSTDGNSWTLLHTYSNPNARGGLCAGLFIGNWFNQPAVSASFEYFKITPYEFVGPG